VPYLTPAPPPWGGVNESGHYYARFEADKTVCVVATDNQARRRFHPLCTKTGLTPASQDIDRGKNAVCVVADLHLLHTWFTPDLHLIHT
jgi:hypothetical protein